MNTQSNTHISNSGNPKGLAYIGSDDESVSAESHSRSNIFDLVLSQLAEFRIVSVYFENCSMVIIINFI